VETKKHALNRVIPFRRANRDLFYPWQQGMYKPKTNVIHRDNFAKLGCKDKIWGTTAPVLQCRTANADNPPYMITPNFKGTAYGQNTIFCFILIQKMLHT